MFKLNTNFDEDSLLYSLTHFECDGHTVHTLTQWLPLPSLTSTVKSSLFTHAHSSLFSLAVKLHWCCIKCSYYINNGWTFSGQTSYISYIFMAFNKTITVALEHLKYNFYYMLLVANHIYTILFLIKPWPLHFINKRFFFNEAMYLDTFLEIFSWFPKGGNCLDGC